jgi:hypothetical protein
MLSSPPSLLWTPKAAAAVDKGEEKIRDFSFPYQYTYGCTGDNVLWNTSQHKTLLSQRNDFGILLSVLIRQKWSWCGRASEVTLHASPRQREFWDKEPGGALPRNYSVTRRQP